ncbi:MAG: CCA tRNA nucleotidyltransferase [Pseudomonadota bacterium]
MSSEQTYQLTPPANWADAEARLKNADWHAASIVQQVFAAFAASGEECRAIGGAVRDTLLSRPVNDLDFSTTAIPDVAARIVREAGFTVHETGLAHGTITAARDGAAYEITTLRADVETDGRHATVAFTTDWSVDAARRDFTINAFSCDRDGKLYDPVGGFVDLAAGRVRFIGDATARIREDRLRILRFFRFSGRYARGALDAEAYAAIAEEKSGLEHLSAERVRAELVRLLITPRAADVVVAMAGLGLFEIVLGRSVQPEIFSALVELEATHAITPEPMRRLSALMASMSSRDVADLQKRLRLSRQEADHLRALSRAATDLSAKTGGDPTIGVALYEHGAPAIRDGVLLVAANDPNACTGLARRLAEAQAWQKPEFPLDGSDLIAAGFEPGPALGVELARIEDAWIASVFTLSVEELRRMIRSPSDD